jgi:suppressor of tumorigenicity protein 13
MDPQKVTELRRFIDLLKVNPDAIHLPELSFFKDYIESLGARIPAPQTTKVEEDFSDPSDPERWDEESEALPPAPEMSKAELSEAEQDQLANIRSRAQDALEDGDRLKALDLLNQAISLGAVTAMLMTKRADLLLKLKRPLAAIRDCDTALSLNPDSGKAFRIRGLAYRHLQKWEKAHADLAAAQRIDFDETTEEVHKLVDEKYKKILEATRKARPSQEPSFRPTSPPRRPASAPEASFPMGGGMGNMFSDLLSDPELASAMTNPRVMQALQEMMTNPAALIQYQSDPEVGPVLMKLMSKFGGAGMPHM